jgi:hypothetical protein
MDFDIQIIVLNVIIFLIQSIRNSLLWQCLITLSKLGLMTYLITLSFLKDLGFEMKSIEGEVKKMFRPLIYMNFLYKKPRNLLLFKLGENDGEKPECRGKWFDYLNQNESREDIDNRIERCLGLKNKGECGYRVNPWDQGRGWQPSHEEMEFNNVLKYESGSGKKYFLTEYQSLMVGKLCEGRAMVQRKGRFFKMKVYKEISSREAFSLILKNKKITLYSGGSFEISKSGVSFFVKKWTSSKEDGGDGRVVKKRSIISLFSDEVKNTGLPVYLSFLSLSVSLYTKVDFVRLTTYLIFSISLLNELFHSIYDPFIDLSVLLLKLIIFKLLKKGQAIKVLDFMVNISQVWKYCDKEEGVNVLGPGSFVVNPVGEATKLVEEELMVDKRVRELVVKKSEIALLSIDRTQGNGYIGFCSAKTDFDETFCLCSTDSNDYRVEIKVDRFEFNLFHESLDIKRAIVTVYNLSKGRPKYFYLPSGHFQSMEVIPVNVSGEEMRNSVHDSQGMRFNLVINQDSDRYKALEVYLKKMLLVCDLSRQEVGFIEQCTLHYQEPSGAADLIQSESKVFKTSGFLIPLGEINDTNLRDFLEFTILGGRRGLSEGLIEFIESNLNCINKKELVNDFRKLFMRMKVMRPLSFRNTDWKKLTFVLNRVMLKLSIPRLFRITKPHLNSSDISHLDRLLKECDKPVDYRFMRNEEEKRQLKETMLEIERMKHNRVHLTPESKTRTTLGVTVRKKEESSGRAVVERGGEEKDYVESIKLAVDLMENRVKAKVGVDKRESKMTYMEALKKIINELNPKLQEVKKLEHEKRLTENKIKPYYSTLGALKSDRNLAQTKLQIKYRIWERDSKSLDGEIAKWVNGEDKKGEECERAWETKVAKVIDTLKVDPTDPMDMTILGRSDEIIKSIMDDPKLDKNATIDFNDPKVGNLTDEQMALLRLIAKDRQAGKEPLYGVGSRISVEGPMTPSVKSDLMAESLKLASKKGIKFADIPKFVKDFLDIKEKGAELNMLNYIGNALIILDTVKGDRERVQSHLKVAKPRREGVSKANLSRMTEYLPDRNKFFRMVESKFKTPSLNLSKRDWMPIEAECDNESIKYLNLFIEIVNDGESKGEEKKGEESIEERIRSLSNDVNRLNDEIDGFRKVGGRCNEGKFIIKFEDKLMSRIDEREKLRPLLGANYYQVLDGLDEEEEKLSIEFMSHLSDKMISLKERPDKINRNCSLKKKNKVKDKGKYKIKPGSDKELRREIKLRSKGMTKSKLRTVAKIDEEIKLVKDLAIDAQNLMRESKGEKKREKLSNLLFSIIKYSSSVRSKDGVPCIYRWMKAAGERKIDKIKKVEEVKQQILRRGVAFQEVLNLLQKQF